MTEFFASGRVFELVIAVLVLEAAVLLLLHRAGRSRLAPRDFLAFCLAGLGLAWSARAAALGLAYEHVAPGLILALAAHLIDLFLRARGKKGAREAPG